MLKKLTQARVFALRGYTVKVDGRDRYFVSPTGLKQWKGPYKSLHHATVAIARKLSREFTQRDHRLLQQKEQRP